MRVKALYDLEGAVRSWLTDLNITIPDPKPFGLRDGEIVDTWDEDDDDVYVHLQRAGSVAGVNVRWCSAQKHGAKVRQPYPGLSSPGPLARRSSGA